MPKKPEAITITFGPKVRELMGMKLAMIAMNEGHGDINMALKSLDEFPDKLLAEVVFLTADLLVSMKNSGDFDGLDDEALAEESIRILSGMANGEPCPGCGEVHTAEEHPCLQIFNTRRN